MIQKAHRGFLAEHGALTAFMYAVADMIAFVAAALLAYYTRHGHLELPGDYRMAILLCLFVMLTVFSWTGLYTSWRGRSYIDQARSATGAWIAVLLVIVLLAFVLKVSATFSRAWLAWLALYGWVFLFIVRVNVMFVLRELRDRGFNHKRVIIVGGDDWGQYVAGRLQQAGWLGMDVVGIVDEDPALLGKTVAGIPVVGDHASLPDLVEREGIDEVWICLTLHATHAEPVSQIDSIRHGLRHSTVAQRLLPPMAELRLLGRPMTEIMGLPVVNLNLSPMRGINRIVKELEDRVLGALILLLVSPLMLAIALAVKLSSRGPVLFRQHRHGWGGKPIEVYKFRTMKVHREADGTITQACRDDGRVTALGRLLRRTSLDELPQFLNVLQGRMSIVGPRPHAVEHNSFYMDQIDSYMQRHKVKPGISGWAQVNGLRGEIDTLEKMRQRVEYDLYYIENWSLWFDLKIILLTLLKGFIHRNAY